MTQNHFDNVIVIGCDKTGKSTLIQSLLNAGGIRDKYKYFKGDKMPTPEEAVAKAKEVMMERKKHMDPMIFDRFHFPDDFVYHPVFAGEELPKTVVSRYFRWVFPELVEQKTLFIYCFADPQSIAIRFVKEKETLVNIDQIRTILDNYIEVLGFLKDHFPIVVLNSDTMTKEEMFDQAYNIIKEGPRS